MGEPKLFQCAFGSSGATSATAIQVNSSLLIACGLTNAGGDLIVRNMKCFFQVTRVPFFLCADIDSEHLGLIFTGREKHDCEGQNADSYG
jgi:hypothetical protein